MAAVVHNADRAFSAASLALGLTAVLLLTFTRRAALEKAHVEGEVLLQFVVNPDGRADMRTFKVLKSSNDLFTKAVKDVLPSMRFVPAEVGGRKVRQLVQMPFGFKVPQH